MLDVFHGPYCRLERAFVDRLNELRAGSPLKRLAVVAPSRRLADRLEQLAAESGSGVAGVHFHTFYSLALSILEEKGAPGEFVGDPLFHNRVIDLILESNAALGRAFGQKRARGLAASLRSSVRDLIDAGVSPKGLADHFEEDWARDPIFALQEAFLQWQRKHGVLGASELTSKAAAAAADSEFLKSFEEILYYGFYDLTGLQLEFFEAVVSAHSGTLFFPYVKEHPAFRFATEFFELKAHGRGAPKPLDAQERSALAPALAGLFSTQPGQPVPAQALKVFSASGSHDEAWLASKEILRLNEEEGVAFDDIAVIARAIEPYAQALRRQLTADAVPFELREQGPLLRQPLARLMLELLRLKERDFPAHVLADILASPYLKPQLPRVDRWLQRTPISAGWLAWEAQLNRAQEEDRPELSRAQARQVLEFLSGVRSRLSSEAPRRWVHWAKAARGLIEEVFSPPACATAQELLTWETVLDAIDGFSTFEPLGPVAWDFFLETLVEKLGGLTLEGPRSRGVNILGAMDARGHRFRVVFMLGLNEGFFPRQVREDALLRDAARAKLKHPGGYWIGQKLAGHEEERLLFYLTASCADERLYAVYSRSDSEGKVQSPSLYLRELCRAAGLQLEKIQQALPRPMEAKLAWCPPQRLNPKELSLRALWRGGKLDEATEAVLERSRPIASFGAAGPMDGMVGSIEPYLKRLAQKGLSPTALDAMSECPFRFFVGRVLGLGYDDEDLGERNELAASIKGKLYHEALERFYRGKPKAPWRPALAKAIEETFHEHGWKASGLYPLVWKAARKDMTERLTELVAWDMERMKAGGLTAALLEAEVSGFIESDQPQLKRIPFHGRVDRIDVDSSGGYEIIDYKTRRRNAKLPKLVGELRLNQVPIYTELVKALPRLQEKQCTGFSIMAIETESDTQERAQRYCADDWKNGREAVLKGIEELLGRIALGRFPIKPEDGEFGHCAYCQFAGMCRKSHRRSRERAQTAFNDGD